MGNWRSRGARCLQSLALVWLLPTQAVGQTATAGGGDLLRPGARVRITPAGGKSIVGWLDAIEDGRLILVGTGEDAFGALTVPVGSIDRVEVRTSRNARDRGFMWGALGGAAVGLAVGAFGASSVEDCSGAFLCLDDLERGMWYVGGVGLGALVGGLVGAGVAGDGWEVVSSDRVRVSVAGRAPLRVAIGGIR